MSISPPPVPAPAMPATGSIDFSLLFMPEDLTPLYHTPAYALLTDQQRLRYNQINALYFNEQTMFFEKSLARNVLGFFLRQPLPAGLKEGLHQFMIEEETHSAMFLRLNRECAPENYESSDFYFIRIPVVAKALLDMLSRRPDWFPFLLWLMHLQEERALFFGRAFLRCSYELEPHFLETQRRHLADEALLDHVWPATNASLRQLNARLLGWMLREYFTTPKRSARRVVAALAREFPGLQSQYDGICRQLEALGDDQTYLQSLYSRETVPLTFKRLDAWREFDTLPRALPGYLPGEAL